MFTDKIEKIFEKLFNSAKSLIDAVTYLHKDLEDFKKTIEKLSDVVQTLRIDMDKLDQTIRDNTLSNLKNKE